jgi:hypothetical protein
MRLRLADVLIEPITQTLKKQHTLEVIKKEKTILKSH